MTPNGIPSARVPAGTAAAQRSSRFVAVGEPAERGVDADGIGGDLGERRRGADSRQRDARRLPPCSARTARRSCCSRSMSAASVEAGRSCARPHDRGHGRIGAVGMRCEELAERVPARGDERAVVEQRAGLEVRRRDRPRRCVPSPSSDSSAARQAARGVGVEPVEVDRAGHADAQRARADRGRADRRLAAPRIAGVESGHEVERGRGLGDRPGEAPRRSRARRSPEPRRWC